MLSCFFYFWTDVVYDTSIIPYLVQLLRQLLQPSPTTDVNKKAFVASTVRNEDTRDAFLIALSEFLVLLK